MTRSVRSAIRAVTVCAVLLVAGCTTTTTDVSSSSSAASSSNQPSTAPVTMSVPAASVPPSSSPTVVSPTTESSTATQPWPADLPADQVAQAEAAIAAYVGYYKLVDQAYMEPGRDWSTEAVKWAADPVKANFLQNLAGTAALGQFGDGSITVYPTVTKVEPGLVTMSVCVDSTNAGFFDKTGASIKAPDAPGTYFRHTSEVQVAQFEGGQWLVTFITDDYTTTC